MSFGLTSSVTECSYKYVINTAALLMLHTTYISCLYYKANCNEENFLESFIL